MPHKDREAGRAYERRWREANKETLKRKRQRKRQRVVAWVQNLKAETPCADCGDRYPYYVMDFDHRDGVTKLNHVNRLQALGNWVQLKAEIEKCDIVCSNCHRERTYRRMNGT